jgi:hypothetical protein
MIEVRSSLLFVAQLSFDKPSDVSRTNGNPITLALQGWHPYHNLAHLSDSTRPPPFSSCPSLANNVGLRQYSSGSAAATVELSDDNQPGAMVISLIVTRVLVHFDPAFVST